MGNSTNTTWMVSCVCLEASRYDRQEVKLCDSRAYRSEKYARDRYKAVIDNLIEQGFSVEDIEVSEDNVYEGVRASKIRRNNGEKIAITYVVYIDRNPVWSQG